ncbi:MAG: ComEC/Rec2 family competence protein, partial [Patescibacteria group bacterium]|nr:ComEC/Rec2 family competence protein [Patescibacteria group bacterium]
ISIVAPLTNSLILLAVPYAMLASFLVGITGLIIFPLGKILGIVAWPILQYIILIINYFSKIPYSSVQINFKTWQWVLIYYLILLITIILIRFKKKNINH